MLSFFSLLLLISASPLACSQTPLQDELLAPNGAPNDYFGQSVSLYGSLALIGAFQDDIGGNANQGTAYVFDCSSSPCIQRAQLNASDGNAGDLFGSSVSLWGTMALVGAYPADVGGNTDQGAAYLFDCSSFPCTQISKLTASDGAASDYFGYSVSLSGSFALIGAYGSNSDRGAAYLFDCSTSSCTEVAKLNVSDGAPLDFFGTSVSLSGSLALVGASSDDVGENINEGSAYLFDCSSLPCTEVTNLTASDGAPGILFGNSVSLSGSLALVGAYYLNSLQGAAYLFDCSSLSCTEVAKLSASDGASGDWFGYSVSLSGTMALVGAVGDEVGGNAFQGSAYLFDCSSLSCIEVDKFVGRNQSYQDFGMSVSVFSSSVLIGAVRVDSFQGAAYYGGYLPLFFNGLAV